jgi:hypothetical protein
MLLCLDENGQTAREAQAVKEEAEGDFPKREGTASNDTD